MTISKAYWDREGDNLRLSMPFSKVDQERRVVSGFATLDNIDKQQDIVTTDASLKAFAKFRGNIREMHQPTAVGKMVSFKEDRYFDPETKKFYSGVYVSAYISKGAQDTWEKVLDGTLSGFSIGGRMNKWDDGYDAKSDATIRIIKDYDLIELSLVDNPANQFANILSVEKVDGVDVVKGDLINNVQLENVFYDESSGLVLLSENESEQSPSTGAVMKNIGFVEKTDNDKVEMIKFLVDSAKGIGTKIDKEVSPMEKNTEDVIEEITEDVVEKSEVAPEADATIEVEKSEDMEEKTEKSMDEEEKVEDEEDEKMDDESSKGYDKDKSEKSDEPEVSKSDEVVEAVAEIRDSLVTAFSDLSSVVKSLHAEIDEMKKSLGNANEQLSAVKQEVDSAKSSFNEFGKRIDAVEADTAFRKSGDLGEIVQEQPDMVEKSLWGGRFLKTADLFK